MTVRSKYTAIPADFRARALRDDIKAVRAHYGIGHETFYRWCDAIGIRETVSTKRPSNHLPKPIPTDFAQHAADSNAALKRRYHGISTSLLTRWRKIVGVVVATPHNEPAPAGFKATVSSMYQAQACRHYDRSDTIIRRWVAETGAKLKSWNGVVTMRAAPQIDFRPNDLAGQAQRHLQKIGPVYKHGEEFRVFGRKMPASEMIAFAERKGFDPHAWERI